MSDPAPFSPIPGLWTALGRRAAVGVGAAAALASLMWDAPLWLACLRGAAAWLVLVLWTRIGRWLVERTLPDASTGATGKGSEFDHGRPN